MPPFSYFVIILFYALQDPIAHFDITVLFDHAYAVEGFQHGGTRVIRAASKALDMSHSLINTSSLDIAILSDCAVTLMTECHESKHLAARVGYMVNASFCATQNTARTMSQEYYFDSLLSLFDAIYQIMQLTWEHMQLVAHLRQHIFSMADQYLRGGTESCENVRLSRKHVELKDND